MGYTFNVFLVVAVIRIFIYWTLKLRNSIVKIAKEKEFSANLTCRFRVMSVL